MHIDNALNPADAIFVLCSIDDRVADYAAQLFLDDYAPLLIFSGGVAHSNDALKTGWSGSEAEHFADIAVKHGVPKDNIILETKAANTGENIQFTYDLLVAQNIQLNSFILVQKPYMGRRTYATFAKQWPDQTATFAVTAPLIAYDDYFDTTNEKTKVINIMVGDLGRIREYPALGFQIAQDIPDTVWQAYEYLVGEGYNKHLIQQSV